MITPMVGILAFRSLSYAQGIYVYGNNRLTARTENGIAYPGVAAGYYEPVEQCAADVGNVQNPVIINKAIIDTALANGWLSQLEHDQTIAYIPVPTPLAPHVTADDVNNLIVGANNTMEYAEDGATTYIPYDPNNLPDLSGNHSVGVRVIAVPGINNAGAITTLTFTTNPVTPPAPNVVEDDVANTVTGMAPGMEYNLDSEGYIPYDATTFSTINFNGVHTLDVRVAAEGINPCSLDTTLTFTAN